VVAIALALLAIVVYIWIRFGDVLFGVTAILALIHDVSIVLGLTCATYYLSQTFLGSLPGGLAITHMRIDLAMIAAFLTIIGYSLNDTIVVFDRIRENRGKLATLSPPLVNAALNQTLSRTVLTSLTTFLAVGVMFLFGGPGIHGFSLALLAGVVVGTYSSIGIATTLVMDPSAARIVCYVLSAGLLSVISRGLLIGVVDLPVALGVIWALTVMLVAAELRVWRRSSPPTVVWLWTIGWLALVVLCRLITVGVVTLGLKRPADDPLIALIWSPIAGLTGLAMLYQVGRAILADRQLLVPVRARA